MFIVLSQYSISALSLKREAKVAIRSSGSGPWLGQESLHRQHPTTRLTGGLPGPLSPQDCEAMFKDLRSCEDPNWPQLWRIWNRGERRAYHIPIYIYPYTYCRIYPHLLRS